jgi:tetratricopeptide (TPR) repeat protein
VGLDGRSRDALTGLASLLSGQPEKWTAALERALEKSPGHAQVLYFLGYDHYVRLDLDAARDAFSTLTLRSPRDPMAQVFLGRIARDSEDMPKAFDHWEKALALDPSNPHAINDWDALLRDLPLDGWEDFKALDHETHRLVTACGVLRARVLARNNLAFRLRDAVSSWTSRGRGRMQYLVEGAPAEAMAGIRRCIDIYEAAVSELPGDDAMMELSFDERWVYAGVLNDAGLMHHYFDPVQDLEKAEKHYLRAFRITDGSYMDAYFYNLQFLYGFEVEGRERRWFRLAAAAKEAILKEDGQGGYEPDLRKRAAAERDYERLRDHLGEVLADEIELEELP